MMKVINYIYLKEYDSTKSTVEINKNYNSYVNNNIGIDNINTTSNNIRYFHDFSDRENHPNLFDTKTGGTNEDRMIYKIEPGSLYSGTSAYGIMNYNFTNSLYKADSKIRKQLNNVFLKKCFLQVYAQEINNTDIGPIELINKSELSYILTPEVKYIHGFKYTDEGKIQKSPYTDYYIGFIYKRKMEFSQMLKNGYHIIIILGEETLYVIGADEKKMKLNTNFSNQFEEYVKSLDSKKAIGRLTGDRIEALKKLKNYKIGTIKRKKN